MPSKGDVGRPKVKESDRIGSPIPVRFKETDRRRIKERAETERVPVSTWIRNIILKFLNGA